MEAREEEVKEEPKESEEELGPIIGSEPGYSASEFAEMIDIHVSKLRRWSLELAKLGYDVMKDGTGRRIYLKSDIRTFAKLKDYIEIKKMSAEESYLAVANMFRDYKHRLKRDIDDDKKQTDKELVTLTKSDFEEIIQAFTKQTEHAVQQAVKETEQRIMDTLNNRDTAIVNSLKQSLETQKLLAAAEDTSPKKGIWSRLFGK